MALSLKDRYPTKVDIDTAYPHGKFRNVIVTGDGRGTPWEKDLGNDINGLQQAIYKEAGIIPSGTPDSADTCQQLEGIKKITLTNGITTSALISSTEVYVSDVVLSTSGFTTSADGGTSSWKQNGVTGQTASQSPVQLLNAAILNDGNGNQWGLINNGTAPLEVSGGVSGGVVDNKLVFQSFLNSGVIGVLANNKTYATGSRSTWVSSESGFVSTGKSKVLMLTSGFDATTYIGYAANSVGFYAEGISRPIFKNIHIEFESHITIRTAIALSLRNCTDLDVNVEASGFSEPQYGIINIDSCVGGEIDVYTHDCTTNNNTLATMQLTGLMVDENRISGVYSKVHIKHPKFLNITLGAAAIAAYGYQADGLTLAGGASSGGGGCVVDLVDVENVYEGVDIQSSNHTVAGIKARNINNSVLKLVHAGKNNTIGAINAVVTGDAVVTIAGTNTASESADNNIIGHVTASGVGDLTGSGGAPKCAVHFSGGGSTRKPNNNKVIGVTITDSPNMLNVILDEAGTKNKVLDVSGTGSVGVATVNSAQLALDYVDIRKSPKSFVNAYLNADQVAAVDFEVIKYSNKLTDSYSELNLSTGVYTSVGPMRGRVSASVRTSALGAGKYIGLDIVVNGAVIVTSKKNWNDSAGVREAIATVTANFSLNNRDVDVSVRLRTNATTLTLTGGAGLSTLSIEEL